MSAGVLPPLVFTTRTVYGVEKIYPANPQAEVLAKLTGKKTVTPAELELAKDLGLTVMATGFIGADLVRFPRAES